MTRTDIQAEAYKRYGHSSMEHWAEKAFIDGAEWLVWKLAGLPLGKVLEEVAQLYKETCRSNKARKGGEEK